MICPQGRLPIVTTAMQAGHWMTGQFSMTVVRSYVLFCCKRRALIAMQSSARRIATGAFGTSLSNPGCDAAPPCAPKYGRPKPAICSSGMLDTASPRGSNGTSSPPWSARPTLWIHPSNKAASLSPCKVSTWKLSVLLQSSNADRNAVAAVLTPGDDIAA